MKAKIFIKKDHVEASAFAAGIISGKFIASPDMKVTLAAGDTPFVCYRQLIYMQSQGKLRLDLARYIGLDEWVGLGPDNEGSCIETMNRGFYNPAAVPRENIFVFDGLKPDPYAEAERMGKVLNDIGGLDLAVLGVGVNGHIGFNEPDIKTDCDFSVVPLSETTKAVGRKYFSGREAPVTGATITLRALKRAQTVVIIATGKNKREAVADILSGEFTSPAGAFSEHNEAYYIFDEDSAHANE